MQATDNPWAAMQPPVPEPQEADVAEAAGLIFWQAVGWIVAGLVVPLVVGFIGGIVTVAHDAGRGLPDGQAWGKSRVFTGLLVILGMLLDQGVMLVGAWRGARRVGQGDRRLGLGWLSLSRPWLIGLLVVIQVPVVALWVQFLRYAGLAIPGNPFQTPLPLGGNWLSLAVIALLLCGLAPLVEELFFRGWMWTGLRRHWRPFPVAVLTGGLWLLLHIFEGWRKLVILLPLAIMLAVARQFGPGVRASLLLHVINNAAWLVGSALLFRT